MIHEKSGELFVLLFTTGKKFQMENKSQQIMDDVALVRWLFMYVGASSVLRKISFLAFSNNRRLNVDHYTIRRTGGRTATVKASFLPDAGNIRDAAGAHRKL